VSEFLQFAFSGLTVGAIYALVALGFTLIYNASRVINFAQGEFVMIGGMITAVLYAAGLPLVLAALCSVFIAATVGLLLYVLAINPARDASPATLIIITMGASLFLRGVMQIAVDKQIHSIPPFSGDTAIRVLNATIQPQTLWVIFGSVVLFAALQAFMTRTLAGQALQATAANRLAARLVGIEVAAVLALAFVISAIIGGIAGVLVTPITLTRYDVGTLLALKGFSAAMVGGMGSPLGAIAGGLFIGLLEAFGAGYLSSTYKDAIAVIAMLIVLMVAPQGLSAARNRSGSRMLAALNRYRYSSILLLTVAIVVLGLLVENNFYLRIAALVWTMSIATIGLNILMGEAGQVSLGHAAFIGFGSYSVALGPAHFGLDPALCLLLGLVISGAVAYVIGRPILRLEGYYLSVATLGLGYLVSLVIVSETALTGGRRHAGSKDHGFRCQTGRRDHLVLDQRGLPDRCGVPRD
jgi:branched-chain amino acid transport system permease protein